jgi:hypothetical protein
MAFGLAIIGMISVHQSPRRLGDMKVPHRQICIQQCAGDRAANLAGYSCDCIQEDSPSSEALVLVVLVGLKSRREAIWIDMA